MIHLGATLSRALSEKFELTGWCQRTLLASGVASAISASFNAPIAVYSLPMKSFWAIILRVLCAHCYCLNLRGLISRLWFGEAAAFVPL